MYQSRDSARSSEAVSFIATLACSSIGKVLIIVLRIILGIAVITAWVAALRICVSAATISSLHLLVTSAVPHMSVLRGLGSDSLFMSLLKVLTKAHSVLSLKRTEGLYLVGILGEPGHLVLIVVLIRLICLYIDVLQLYHLIKD